MRSISYTEFQAAAGLNNNRMKVQRFEGALVGAFGRTDVYESMGHLEVDSLAVRLRDLLTEKLSQKLAADIVRDQWGIWMRVAALAETSGQPTFFYVIEYETAKGKRHHMTLGSMLDDREPANLLAIAEDLRARAGVTAKHYVVVEMHELLESVRAAARDAGFDFSAPFLPPYGSAELDAVLKPFDESAPDRAIVVTGDQQKQQTKHAQRSGAAARATVEAFSKTVN